MKVVMSMAGRGSRFHGSGFTRPKPLIEVKGIPMFVHALKSIEKLQFSSLIFIALQEHQDQFDIESIFKQFVPYPYELVLIPEVTEGQLCTVIAAKQFLDSDESILIISSDTIVESNLNIDIENLKNECHGLISVADMPGERWSFAKTDANGRVIQVTEKIKISDHASTGLYYFNNGKIFIDKAEKMIKENKKTKGEFFIMPLYQEYINENLWIGISKATQMWDLGTPESLQHFLDNFKN